MADFDFTMDEIERFKRLFQIVVAEGQAGGFYNSKYTGEEIDNLLIQLSAGTPATKTAEINSDDFGSYIDSLPRLISETLVLNVSGEIDTAIDIRGFFGGGSITINGNNNFLLRNRLRVVNCNAAVTIQRVLFEDTGVIIGSNGILCADNSYCRITGCEFNGLGANSLASAIEATNGARFVLGSAKVKGFYSAVMSSRSSILSIDRSSNTEFSSNSYGVYVWNGGIVLLGGNIPDTLGAASNIKSGGLIVKSNGTLI